MSPRSIMVAGACAWSLAMAVSAMGQPRQSGPASALPQQVADPPAAARTPLRINRDLEYARAGAKPLLLDLYLRPTPDKAPLPVVMWLHGDGPVDGGRSPAYAARLVADGYAVASIDYRTAGEAPFPGQLQDAKAAVRWLRANAAKYNLDAGHIGVWGEGAGGRLAALLGVTGDKESLEGREGNPGQSSKVQAVVDLFGPVQSAPDPPVDYVSGGAAPFLIVHGTADTTVSPRQSEALQIALKHAGVENDLEYVTGAGHDIRQVHTETVAEIVVNFFDKHLRGDKHLRNNPSAISEPADAWIDPFPDEMPGTHYMLYDTPSRGAHTQGSYRIYLPPGYDSPANAKRRYPVIYFLHGLGDDSRQSVASGYIGRVDAAERNGVMPKAIVVCVQAPNAAGYVDWADGKTPVETVFIKDLIPHIDRTYRTIAAKAARAMDGHSMGGVGSMHMAFRFPEMFASMSSFSAAARDRTGNDEINRERYGGDVARHVADTPWDLAEKNAARIRGHMSIRMIVGDKDDLLERNTWMSKLLDNLNIKHSFITSPGAPHALKEVLSRLDENPFAYYAKVFAAYM